MDSDVSDLNQRHAQDYLTDTLAWDALLKRGAAGQAPASFTPTATARRSAASAYSVANGIRDDYMLASNDKDIFLTMASPVFSQNSIAIM